MKQHPPLGHLSAGAAALHGAWRGAVMGAAYAVVVVVQAYFIDVVAPFAPESVRPFAAVTARWVTTSATAFTGTAAAGVVYLILWNRHRRRGWSGYEGQRVALGGFACYLGTGAVVLVSRAMAWTTEDGLVHALGTTPPLWLLAVLPPVVYAWFFSRAALDYRGRSALVR